MLLHLLLLLTLLGPGNSLQLWDTLGEGVKEASGPALIRGRRQAGEDDEFEDPDYPLEATDLPELLENITNPVTTNPESLTTMGTMEQRTFMRPGIPEPATVEATAIGSAGPDAGGAAVGKLSTEPVTQRSLTTVEMTTQLAAAEAETSQPAAAEPETSQPAAAEPETTQPVVTEAETSQPAAVEPETSQPAAAKPETTQAVVTEAETSQSPRKSKAVKVLFTEPTATEPLSIAPVTTKFLSTGPTGSIIFLGPSATQENITMTRDNLSDIGMKKGQIVTPGSSVAPSSTGTSDLIPVRQCLLAILILALLATIFLVCTVVLAVRLSRKNHMYPVRNYSPTEMVCISSLLPDGGEGPPVTANGGLPKSQGLKAESSEDRDGDDLTLHSFLP
ncbi:P-selectin glycoprotein ligand 1 isoform X2 [Nannospalax galili]|nr:P-selectin glycoprotein ligand 1 isoform X2 [Nannospalax galili]